MAFGSTSVFKDGDFLRGSFSLRDMQVCTEVSSTLSLSITAFTSIQKGIDDSYPVVSYHSNPPPGLPTRQQVVDILLLVMVHGKEHTFSVSCSTLTAVDCL